MRAALLGLMGRGGLHAAGGVGLAIAWVYAVDRAEPVFGLGFLVASIVALGWARWLRPAAREGSDREA